MTRKKIVESQQKYEPVDPEFFRLFFTAVHRGIALIRELEQSRSYYQQHLFFHRARSVPGKAMPTFTEAALIDYSSAFGDENSLISWRTDSAITELVEYSLQTREIETHFRTAKYTLAGENYQLTDKQVEFFVVRTFAGIVDMCISKLAGDEITSQWFKGWYREVERSIFDERLEVDLIIPIVGISFDFDSLWLDDQKVAVFRMNNEFQEARFLHQHPDIKVPAWVAGFSSHAFLLKNREIRNDGFMQIEHEAESLIRKEMPQINSLFGLLKAATGKPTGYAQVVLHPIMWAQRYIAHLPVVIGETVRAYPTSFDDGVWRNEPEIVSANDLSSITSILADSSTFNHKRIRLAVSRLNSCLLRDNPEDKILDACIGLEALFSDQSKQEMTHKLALRIAGISNLFERGEYVKKEVFDAVKTIYNYRSAIAHGGSGKMKDQIVTISGHSTPTVEFAIDILREAIIALGRNSRFLNPEEIDIHVLLDSPA